MISVTLSGVLLLVLTTVIHYEALRALSQMLPSISVRSRAKLLVVIFATFASHVAHIVLYAGGFYLLTRLLVSGEVAGAGRESFASYIYFSAETYTSLGFGDLVPIGATRLLAGIEALNGLLLIAWSASYTYLAMERFWAGENGMVANAGQAKPSMQGARASVYAGQVDLRSAFVGPPCPHSVRATLCAGRLGRTRHRRNKERTRRAG